MTTTLLQLRLLRVKVAAFKEMLDGVQRHYLNLGKATDSAAKAARAVDRDGAARIGPARGMDRAHLNLDDVTLIRPNRAVLDGRETKLSRDEFRLLDVLKNRARDLSHDQIIREVWGPARQKDLPGLTGRLQAKLDAAGQPPRIESSRRRASRSGEISATVSPEKTPASVHGRRSTLGAPEMTGPARAEPVTFGSLKLDLATGIATRDGRDLKLSRTPFRILEQLMRARGGVVTLDELAPIVGLAHKTPAVSLEFGLKPHVNRLDVALDKPGLIHTVRGVGWYLAKS